MKKALFIIIILMTPVFSCKKESISLQELSYKDSIIEGSTNIEGKIKILTTFPDKEVKYDLTVINEAGNPVEGMEVSYNQLGDNSVFFIKDPQNRYSSAFLYGPPIDLQNKSKRNDSKGSNDQYESNSIILLIGLVVTVAIIAKTEVDIIMDAYEIQEFYITDAVLADKDYILYCKTFDEIAGLIKARTGIALGASSILLSYVTAGGSKVYEIAGDVLMQTTEEIRDDFVDLAIESWGRSMNEIVNRKVAVKIYPFDKDENFANIKNLYAVYEIDYENTVCTDYINDVPFKVNDIITQATVDQLEEDGLVIHKGFDPPDVTGNYFINDLRNLENGDPYIDYSYQFQNQTEDFEISIKASSTGNTMSGNGAFISGSENAFSIYCETEHNVNDNGHTVYLKTIDIYSGIMSNTGIQDYQNGFIIVEKTNDINNSFMNVNDTRIVYEADGLVEKVSDFPHVPKGTEDENGKIFIRR